MKDPSFPTIRIFNKYASIGDAKRKKKKTKKIKNPFASSARKNGSKWQEVPESPASTKATIELALDEGVPSNHWKQLDHWSVYAAPTASQRKEQSSMIDDYSLGFIDTDNSDWMELEVDGTVSPQRGNSSHHRRSEYNNSHNDLYDSDNESLRSSISAITMSPETMERRSTIDSSALDAIYDDISVKTTHHDEDSINGYETIRLGIPLLDHKKITSSSRSIDSTDVEQSDSMVRSVRTTLRQSIRIMLASDHRRQFTPLSSSQSTCSD